MGVINELTYLHMEVLTSMEEIERRLRRLKRLKAGEAEGHRVADGLATSALRLRRRLVRCQESQEKQVFRRVRRICGDETEELVELRRGMERSVEALEAFISALPEGEEADWAALAEDLEDRFEKFDGRYNERCEAEQNFLQSYSTILYPGGLATE